MVCMRDKYARKSHCLWSVPPAMFVARPKWSVHEEHTKFHLWFSFNIRHTKKCSKHIEEITFEAVIHDKLDAVAVDSRTRPQAYIIKKNQHDIIEKLNLLGFKLEDLKLENLYNVEQYIVEDYFNKMLHLGMVLLLLLFIFLFYFFQIKNKK